jgi:CRP-like cAMP-binding protein
MSSAGEGRRRGAAGRLRGQALSSKQTPNGLDETSDGRDAAANDRDQRFGVPVWRGGNRILATIPSNELDFLRPDLTEHTLASGQVLYQQQSNIDTVFFPDTAVTSLLSRMDNGAVVEVGTIGNEGAVGLGLFLGSSVSIPETLAQIPGGAQSIPASTFVSAIAELPRFREIVGRCTHAFMMQVSQTAVCNRLHGIEQRCARWLLLTHDRVGGADSFPLTHQFLSFMLGVRRAGVTEALGVLTRSGLIKSGRGEITVVDRAGLEASCCECYAIVRRHAGEPFETVG